MALDTNELFSEVSRDPFPRFRPVHVFSKKIDGISGAPLLGVGMPMAYDTTNLAWVPFVDGGSNGTGTIRAFVYPDPIQTDATNEVLGQLMVAGEAHHDDVLVPSGELQADVTAALKAGLSASGLYITGIPGIY